MKYIFSFLYFIIMEYIFFGLTAKYQGHKCNYDCIKCKCWSCTHGTEYENKPCYPVRDWGKWCGK